MSLHRRSDPMDVPQMLEHLFRQQQHARLMCLFMRSQAPSVFGPPVTPETKESQIQQFLDLVVSAPQPPPKGILGLPEATAETSVWMAYAVQNQQWMTLQSGVFNDPRHPLSQELLQIERQIDSLSQEIAELRLRVQYELLADKEVDENAGKNADKVADSAIESGTVE